MAKKESEEKKVKQPIEQVEENFDEKDIEMLFDDESIDELPMIKVENETEVDEYSYKPNRPSQVADTSNEVYNCLRNEKVTVRYIPKQSQRISNPKHVLYGGMAENAFKQYTVPQLQSGALVNVLTDNEKAYLEQIMGLEFNALSVYKKIDNYWHNRSVRLNKQDNMLDLSVPDDYIKYKILLANKERIAPNLEAWQNYPKATYEFVIISEGEEVKSARTNMSFTMESYKEFGKIENNIDKLRFVVETLDGRPTSKHVKPEFLQTRINELIQADAKLFLKVVTDELIDAKVLIKKGIEEGFISNRGNYLYWKADNTPLCETGEDPTLNIAARYITSPKRQELKFSLEAKLKD